MIVYIPLGFAAFTLSILGLKKAMALFINKIAQAWALLLIRCTGCRLTVSGKEKIPRRGGICFVSNHVGIFDIVLALGLIGRPFGFIAKKELLLIPMLNIWISLLGGLFIDRKRPKKALATINEGIRRLKNGGGMLIFPEGTRSKGQGLLPFHSGSLKLAAQAEVPIVPMAITGSYDVFEKTHRVQAVPVTVTFMDPVNTAGIPQEERKQLLSDLIRQRIAAALGNVQ
jgi:1-acyl-sn-glycerol-3-phosphate acyltransferase